MPCTFYSNVCESLIGNALAGNIKKIKVDPYEYSNPETGEIMSLSHRYEFLGPDEEILDNHLIEEELVS